MRRETRRVLTAELWRSVVWAGLALVGWGFLAGESAAVPTTLPTTVGLPLFTWLLVTCGAVGVRLWRSRGHRLRSRAGRWLGAVGTLAAGGILAVCAVSVLDRSPLVVGSLYLAVALGAALWLAVFDRQDGTTAT
jgi:peptidoglycan/LPS O-acetylase OafA/YrhL